MCWCRFTGLKDSKGNTYFYNPCHAYNAGGQGCDVVYVRLAACAILCMCYSDRHMPNAGLCTMHSTEGQRPDVAVKITWSSNM